MAALSSWGAGYWLLFYMVGGMQIPVREPGAQEEGMLSCLNFGKSHRKDASEPWHCSSATWPLDRQVLIRGVCPTGKESAFHRMDSGYGPRELVLQKAWRVSGTLWC